MNNFLNFEESYKIISILKSLPLEYFDKVPVKDLKDTLRYEFGLTFGSLNKIKEFVLSLKQNEDIPTYQEYLASLPKELLSERDEENIKRLDVLGGK